MKLRTVQVVIILMFTLVTSNLAQQMIKISGKNAMFLDELKSVIKGDGDNIIVEFSVDKSSRMEPYRDIDVQKGDEILFINGKRVKKFEDFKDTYDKLAAGDEIELGIKRANERFFQTFAKADQAQKGDKGHAIKVQQFSGEDGPQKIEMKNGKAVINGKVVNIDSLKKTGKGMMIIGDPEPADSTKKVNKHD